MAEPTDIIAERAACAPGAGAGSAHDVVNGSSEDDLVVCDDLSERPPVSVAELDVIETFFADILDMALRGEADVSAASLRHKPLR